MKNFSWFGSDVTKVIVGEQKKRMTQACMVVQSHIKKEIQRKRAPGGEHRIYKKPARKTYHVASAPGEYPAAMHGEAGLQGSLDWEISTGILGIEGYVGVRKDMDANAYALYLELGTSKMRPRPFLRQGLSDCRAKVAAILGGKMK